MVQQYRVDMEDEKVVASKRTCLTFQRSEHHKTFSKNWNDLGNERVTSSLSFYHGWEVELPGEEKHNRIIWKTKQSY